MRAATLLVLLSVAVAACGGSASEPVCPKTPVAPSAGGPAGAAPATAAGAAAAPAPTAEEAVAFIAQVEEQLLRLWRARDQSAWGSQTFITDDSEALAAAGEEAAAAYVAEAIKHARRFDAIRDRLAPEVARKLYLLTISQTIPAPSDSQRRAELAG